MGRWSLAIFGAAVLAFAVGFGIAYGTRSSHHLTVHREDSRMVLAQRQTAQKLSTGFGGSVPALRVVVHHARHKAVAPASSAAVAAPAAAASAPAVSSSVAAAPQTSNVAPAPSYTPTYTPSAPVVHHHSSGGSGSQTITVG